MRLGSKAKLTMAVGLVAAGGFAFMGIRQLGRQEAEAQVVVAPLAQRPQVVLAATTRTIRTGETIRADMIRTARADPARWPTAALPAELIGKVATRDIPAGTLVPRSAVDEGTKLAIRVPMGMRAMSIDTTAEIAVAGLVRPGDRVDVQVVYPGADAITGMRGDGRSRARTLLQMVEVLAVGDMVVGTPAPEGVVDKTVGTPPPPPGRTVTLALSPEQISELTLAKSTGALTLALRNPRDAAKGQVAQVVSSPGTGGSLRETLAAAGPAPVAAARPAAAAVAPARKPARAAPSGGSTRSAPAPRSSGHAIELVVGGSSRTIYSGSDAQ